MVAKGIMLLFPIGVVLALLYSGATFFQKEEVPAPIVATEEPSLIETPVVTEREESTSTDAVATTTTSTSTPKVATSTPAVKLQVSSTPLHLGIYGDGWANNSWGTKVVHDKKSATLVATYHKPWEAFSVYSEGMTTAKYRSIELVFTSKNTDSRTLFLSLYNGTTKVGAVPLFPYQVPTKFGMFRIPLADIATTSSKFTDIVIESDHAQSVQFSELRLSDTNASSHLSEIYPVASVDTAPTVTPEPAPVPAEPVVMTPPAAKAKGGNIFFQGLAEGWKVVTRRGTVIETMEDENQSVTGKAIKLHFTLQDGSLSFEHPGGIDTTGYRYLHMKIYGGLTDYQWQQLIVTLYGENDKKLGTRDVMMYSGNGRIQMQNWNNANIPLYELGATDTVVKSIDIENVNVTQDGDHVWIDDVRLVDDYTAI